MRAFSLTSLTSLASLRGQRLFAVSSAEEISMRGLSLRKAAFKITKKAPLNCLILQFLVGLGLLAMPVHAQVDLFNNLTAGSPNGQMGVSNVQWMAQAFSTTSEGFILSDVSLRLWNLNGTSGNFEIQVWDSSGASASPGEQVGQSIYTGLAQNLGSSPGYLLTISGLSVNLAANTDYYLVAAGKTMADVGDQYDSMPGFLYWDATNVNMSSLYGTTGSGWGGPSQQNLYMQVVAVHSPGNSPGIQTFSGNLTYALSGGNGPTVNWQLSGNTDTNFSAFDQIVVGGNLAFNTPTSLVLDFSGYGDVDWADTFWTTDQSWVIYDVAGTTTGANNFSIATANWADNSGDSFNNALAGSAFSLGLQGNDLVLNYTAGTSAVPEPGQVAASLLLLSGIGIYLWRRKHAVQAKRQHS